MYASEHQRCETPCGPLVPGAARSIIRGSESQAPRARIERGYWRLARWLAWALFTFGALFTASRVSAQDWPNRPIHLVMPFAPGGLVESVLAVVREPVEARLGQRLILEHKAGAGGIVGMQSVLAATADGYTMAVVPSNTMVINQFLYRDMPFDPLRDFQPVTLLVDVPLVLSISARLPMRRLDEFLAYARSHPGAVHYGSPGPGTPPHLAGELLARAAHLDLVHVPYKGGAAAATALMANEIQCMLIAYVSLAGQTQGSAVRPLAVIAPARLAALPDTPTMAEAGEPALADALPSSWWGIVAARGTPENAIRRTAEAFAQALSGPLAAERLRDSGLVPNASNATAFAQRMTREAAYWQVKMSELNIKAE